MFVEQDVSFDQTSQVSPSTQEERLDLPVPISREDRPNVSFSNSDSCDCEPGPSRNVYREKKEHSSEDEEHTDSYSDSDEENDLAEIEKQASNGFLYSIENFQGRKLLSPVKRKKRRELERSSNEEESYCSDASEIKKDNGVHEMSIVEAMIRTETASLSDMLNQIKCNRDASKAAIRSMSSKERLDGVDQLLMKSIKTYSIVPCSNLVEQMESFIAQHEKWLTIQQKTRQYKRGRICRLQLIPCKNSSLWGQKTKVFVQADLLFRKHYKAQNAVLGEKATPEQLNQFCVMCIAYYENINAHLIRCHYLNVERPVTGPIICTISRTCRATVQNPPSLVTHIAQHHCKRRDVLEFIQLIAYVKAKTGCASRTVEHLVEQYHNTLYDGKTNTPRLRLPGDSYAAPDLPIWRIKQKDKRHKKDGDKLPGERQRGNVEQQQKRMKQKTTTNVRLTKRKKK